MIRDLWYYLWIAPHLLLGFLLWVMWRRRALRQLPIFFWYALFELLQFGVLFSVRLTHAATKVGYILPYGVGLGVSAALRFGVIQEVFGQLFRNAEALTGPAKTVGRLIVLLLIAVALLLAALSPGVESDFLRRVIHSLDRAVSVLQCGLLMALLFFSRYFVSERGRAFGVALGLGILASVELGTSAVRVYGTAGVICDFITMATYHICVLIWLFYFWRRDKPEPPGPPSPVTKVPQVDLEEWNRELDRLLR